jgi:nicotinate-nucleotide adenylyltransferase
MKRVGIFSGTFDPVHKGHVAFALQALEKAELDMVYFAPEVKPRRKPQVTHYAHRVAMLKLAVRPYKKLAVLELPERYFSAATTLPKLQQKFPDSRLVLLLGSDLFEHLPLWPKADRLLGSVGLVVGARGNYEVAEALARLPHLPAQPQEFHVLDSIERQTSSAAIRGDLVAGRPSGELVPSVAKYARDHWLYHDITKARKTKR